MADFYADNYKKVFVDKGIDLNYGAVDTNGSNLIAVNDFFEWKKETGSDFDNTDQIEIFSENIPAGATIVCLNSFLADTGTTATIDFKLKNAQTGVVGDTICTTSSAETANAEDQSYNFKKVSEHSTIIAVPSGAMDDQPGSYGYLSVTLVYATP